MKENDIEQLERQLCYEFNDKELLIEAVTHTSRASDRLKSNERLEFFGDAVLDLVICQELFEKFPDYDEGDLTKIKSMLVSRKTCSSIAKDLDLVRYLKIGKGLCDSRGLTGSVAAGAYEAIVAAIYLDGGLDQVRKFIFMSFDALIAKVNSEQHQENFKSLLQQYAQKNLDSTVSYEVIDEQGPDHNKCFESEAIINSRRFDSAWGINKKASEQRAAKKALIELGVIEDQEEDL